MKKREEVQRKDLVIHCQGIQVSCTPCRRINYRSCSRDSLIPWGWSKMPLAIIKNSVALVISTREHLQQGAASMIVAMVAFQLPSLREP